MNQPVDFEGYEDHLRKILTSDLLPLDEINHRDPGTKVIHDAIWGSRLFYPWEIALLDTPLCQRLRRISQLGTAFLTYPSAVHTRFSHSLGVCVLAGRLITRLKEKAEIQKGKIEISQKDIYSVRIAGLLHDVGHCFFSHASERALEPIIASTRKKLDIGKPKPHEFISYLILTNEYFLNYWENYIVPIFPNKKDCPNPNDIAKMVIGIPPSDEKRYLQDIIYGPYDVDKLEYLYRDARTAGLAISYDIERYFYKITLTDDQKGTRRLAMDIGGVRAIEQIIFSKMMLYSFVYHHHKVLASDILILELIMELLENPVSGQIRIEHPLDLLRYTDYDLLSSVIKGPTERFSKIRKKIILRELPKRCYVINKEFVKGLETDILVKKKWDNLKEKLRGLPKDVKEIRQDIVDIIKKEINSEEISLDDIYVDLPKVPPIEEQTYAPVIDSNGDLKAMSNYFDLEGWQTTYDLKKLKGYFFASEKFRHIASKVIERYLKEKYDLTFNENAKIEAKMLDQNLPAT